MKTRSFITREFGEIVAETSEKPKTKEGVILLRYKVKGLCGEFVKRVLLPTLERANEVLESMTEAEACDAIELDYVKHVKDGYNC